MTNELGLLMLICLLSGVSVMANEERVGRATMALAVCGLAVWLKWYGG